MVFSVTAKASFVCLFTYFVCVCVIFASPVIPLMESYLLSIQQSKDMWSLTTLITFCFLREIKSLATVRLTYKSFSQPK